MDLGVVSLSTDEEARQILELTLAGACLLMADSLVFIPGLLAAKGPRGKMMFQAPWYLSRRNWKMPRESARLAAVMASVSSQL